MRRLKFGDFEVESDVDGEDFEFLASWLNGMLLFNSDVADAVASAEEKKRVTRLNKPKEKFMYG